MFSERGDRASTRLSVLQPASRDSLLPEPSASRTPRRLEAVLPGIPIDAGRGRAIAERLRPRGVSPLALALVHLPENEGRRIGTRAVMNSGRAQKGTSFSSPVPGPEVRPLRRGDAKRFFVYGFPSARANPSDSGCAAGTGSAFTVPWRGGVQPPAQSRPTKKKGPVERVPFCELGLGAATCRADLGPALSSPRLQPSESSCPACSRKPLGKGRCPSPLPACPLRP